MVLDKYKSRRDFKKTREPSDEDETMMKKLSKDKIFVIQEHHAKRLHWDLRLEIMGVLKSWALPKEPPTDKGIKRLAVQTEDHPIEYAKFEGIIPKGEYGAGTVKIWDEGSFLPEKIDIEKEILIELFGNKLKGSFALIKLKENTRFKSKNNWLFFRRKV